MARLGRIKNIPVDVLYAMEDANRRWKVGDKCAAYNLRSNTVITKVEGDTVTMANGDSCHISRVRRER